MIRAIKNSREKIDLTMIITILGLIGLFVFANFSFPKERIIILFIGSVVFTSFLLKCNSLARLKPLPTQLLSLSFLTLLTLSIIASAYRIRGEYFTKQITENQQIGKGLSVIDYSKKAQSVFYTVDPTGTPIKSYEGWGYNEVTDLQGLLNANQEAVSLCPYNYHVLANYGYILERTFNYQDAEKVLLFAYDINNKYESTLLNLSVLYFNQGDYEESLTWLEKISGHQEKYPQNYERISDAIMQSYNNHEL